jgi:hypothetical protein
MVERRQRADALEFLGTDFDAGEPFGVVEMRSARMRHGEKP